MPGDIWLADVLRAVYFLDPKNEATRSAICALLGFEQKKAEEKARKISPVPWTSEPPPIALEPPAEEEVTLPSKGRGEREPQPEPMPLRVLEPITYEYRGLAGRWTTLSPLESVTALHLEEKPPHTPLLAPHWTRSILATALATKAEGGPLDITRIVTALAQAQPLERLPHLPRRSLHRGVQLLIDIGVGMQPFTRDQKILEQEIRRLVGYERVRVLRFRDSPLRKAGSGPIWTWKPYQPSTPGTPVLVLTDLGIGGPRFNPRRSTLEEWLALASMLNIRASSLIALIPYPPRRWPEPLRQALRIIQWDRITTTAAVRNALGGFLEIRR